jgi:hypothetical protein
MGTFGRRPLPRSFAYPSERRSNTGAVSAGDSVLRYLTRDSSGTRDQSYLSMLGIGFSRDMRARRDYLVYIQSWLPIVIAEEVKMPHTDLNALGDILLQHAFSEQESTLPKYPGWYLSRLVRW